MNTQLISADAYGAALSLSDLTDPVYGLHALQPLLRSVIEQIQQAWGCALIVHRGERVVSTADNYDLLGYTPDAAARDARYSRYVSPTRVLRTHTSALIPGLLRSLAPSPRGDLLLACPGVVYRRDVIDRLHVGEPHQLDLWRIRQGAFGERDLSEMIERVVQALLPGTTYRTHPAAHPYTEHGLE